MSWRIRLFASREDALAAGIALGLTAPPVGAMWPYTFDGEGAKDVDQWCEWYAPAVARRYLREHKHLRPPLFVRLPDGTEFGIDFCSSPEIGQGGGEGWSCSGEPPGITLSPSILIVGRYHGWIQNGLVTDDCDGRQFPDARGIPD